MRHTITLLILLTLLLSVGTVHAEPSLSVSASTASAAAGQQITFDVMSGGLTEINLTYSPALRLVAIDGAQIVSCADQEGARSWCFVRAVESHVTASFDVQGANCANQAELEASTGSERASARLDLTGQTCSIRLPLITRGSS